MPLKLTGGSLTLSVAALAIVWTVRSVRFRRRRRSSSNPPGDSSSKYFATLSLEAIALLAHLDAIPHCFIDVRAAEDAAAAPLANWVAPAVNIPEPQLQAALKQPSTWHNYAAAAAVAAAAAAAAAAASAAATLSGTVAAQGSSTAGKSSAEGASNTSQQQQPSRRHLLVILAESEEQQRLAVSRAAAAGFDRVAVPACGIEQLLDVHLPHSTLSREEQVVAAAAAAAMQFPAIHSDALAVLLGLVPLPVGVWQLFSQQGLTLNPSHTQQQQQRGRSPGHTRSNSSSNLLAAAGDAAATEGAAAVQQQQQQQRLLLVDVRRHDERTLYGTIPGAHHIPADELASALDLTAGDFRRQYHFEPPNRGQDMLVLHSRATSRAQWAAQICRDAGCKYVFVYPDGVLGWNFGPGVDAYAAYQQGDKPPEPLPRTVSEPDAALGLMELQQLGLVPLLMQQHGVVA